MIGSEKTKSVNRMTVHYLYGKDADGQLVQLCTAHFSPASARAEIRHHLEHYTDFFVVERTSVTTVVHEDRIIWKEGEPV